MDRRSFLRMAVGGASSLAIAGCLGDDTDEDITNVGEGPPQYDRPAYSVWPPAEGRDGGGVVFMHLRLDTLQVVETAAAEGRLPTDQSIVGLPLYSIEVVPAAIETITSYSFAAPLREAVNVAARTDSEAPETVVEPIAPRSTTTENGTASGSANETAPNGTTIGATNETTPNGTTTDATNETTGGSTNGTTANTTNRTTVENETGSADQDGFDIPIVGDDDDATDETATDRLGIEVEAVTLTADLLVFDGRFDRQVIADRHTTGFEQVDSQRGIEIYEAVGESELAFAVGEDTLVVPTEAPERTTPAETVLAHGLSSYIATLDRVADTEDGGWLYETTGETALSVGVWGTDTPLSLLASRAGGTTDPSSDPSPDPSSDPSPDPSSDPSPSPLSDPPTGDEGGPVFGAASGLIDGLAVTTDDSGTITEVDARFAGVFPNAVPTEEQLRTTLVGEGSGEETTVYIDESRAHLGTPVGSN